MPRHPFKDEWTSYTLNPSFTLSPDGKMKFEITDGGVYNSGKHKKNAKETNLALRFLSVDTLLITDADGTRYDGFLVRELSNSSRSVVIGTYTVPDQIVAPAKEKRSKKKRAATDDQDNGIWIATKP